MATSEIVLGNLLSAQTTARFSVGTPDECTWSLSRRFYRTKLAMTVMLITGPVAGPRERIGVREMPREQTRARHLDAFDSYDTTTLFRQ